MTESEVKTALYVSRTKLLGDDIDLDDICSLLCNDGPPDENGPDGGGDGLGSRLGSSSSTSSSGWPGQGRSDSAANLGGDSEPSPEGPAGGGGLLRTTS